MKQLAVYGLILANVIVLVGISRAGEPRQINTDAIADLWGSVGWAWTRLEKGVSTAADKREERNRKLEQGKGADSNLCQPEFDPVDLTEVTKLPKKRTIKEIQKRLGQPCTEDAEFIYYTTNTGETIRFNKRTGAGSFGSPQR